MSISSRDLYVYQIALMYGIFRKLKDEYKKPESDVGLDILIIHAIEQAVNGMTFSGIKAYWSFKDYNAERTDIRIRSLINRGVLISDWRFGIRYLLVSPDMQKIIKTYRAVPYGHRLMMELPLPKKVFQLLERIRHHE